MHRQEFTTIGIFFNCDRRDVYDEWFLISKQPIIQKEVPDESWAFYK